VQVSVDYDNMEAVSTDELISFTILLESVVVGIGLIIFLLVHIL